MANIKITDALHAKLKEAADANYRTIGGQIEYLMSLEGTPAENTPLPKNTEPKNPKVDGSFEKSLATPGGRGLTVGDVLADIRQLEADRDEELRHCQDNEYAKTIRDRYAQQLQPLWDEYHALKD